MEREFLWDAQFDEPNHNGRIYPLEESIDALTEFMKNPIKPVVFSFEPDWNSFEVPLDEIVGDIISYKVDGSSVFFTCKILETPRGIVAKKLLSSGSQMELAPCSTATLKPVGDHTQVSIEKFTAFQLVETESKKAVF